MNIRNYTPFMPLLFSSRNLKGDEFWVLVLRGTFRIEPDRPLQPVQTQEPIVKADMYHGDPSNSSLRIDSDLAPFKPTSDIHIHATAHAPGGRSAPAWEVCVQVGALAKKLRVTGPRQWDRHRRDFRLSEPEPCLEVPMRYEHSFGGSWPPQAKEKVFEENPVGVGYVPPGVHPDVASIPAPRIEALGDPVREFARLHRPQGLGPIARSWLPRRRYAGTYDESGRSHGWPGLPPDFDFLFYNSAHPDLICPAYLRGDETVLLRGFHASHELRFFLPGYWMMTLAKRTHKLVTADPLVLDTLHIDTGEGRVWLTWRSVFLDDGRIESIEIRRRS